MPGCALPITPYARIPPKRRGQRRGILRVDARTRAGRLLRDVRKTLLEHVGSTATAIHKRSHRAHRIARTAHCATRRQAGSPRIHRPHVVNRHTCWPNQAMILRLI